MNAPLPTHLLSPQDTVADIDPQETAEWRDAFVALVATEGPERARLILAELVHLARTQQIGWQPQLNTPYVNTVAVQNQPVFPGDLAVEERLASIMRWNALAMVVRANQADLGGSSELGGHIASYASAADLFESGFNHFFRAREGLGEGQHRGDLVFFQPHSAPGVYARAFLEGRLSEQDLMHYRQELTAPAAGAQGLCSYPHPWLMPDFWQFPTGSMGIGPISSIYHARFMRYLTHRNLLNCEGRNEAGGHTAKRRVWGVFGDGEMDEPESMSALTLAAREGLDNLVWVVNCNLQRLDGPVRGNGRIIDELERLFAGAGWNVVKLVWGSDWDGLFARDLTGALARTLQGTVDGQMQTFAAKDGRFNRDNFFGQSPELAALAQGMTDEQIDRLKRGGHDLVKIHAAYAAAAAHKGQPTVILAHTKKGYGMGTAGQGKMTTHSQKKLDDTDLIEFRNRFNLPLTDAQATGLAFYKPAEDSPEMQYLRRHRQQLGGYLPRRETVCDALPVPAIESYAQFALQADGKEMSTTMAFVRMLGTLLKDATLGPRIVPIVADEARTFGMANLFKQVGIYSSVGQRYAPEDIGSVLSYREALDGFRFDIAAGILYEFTWNQFCDWYLELTKPVMNGGSESELRGTRHTLVTVLEGLLRLAHPIIPFITETIWQRVKVICGITADTIMLQPFPQYDASQVDEAALADTEWLKQAIVAVRNIRAEMNIAPGKPLELLLRGCSEAAIRRVNDNRSFLLNLARLESITVLPADDKGPVSVTKIIDGAELLIPMAGLINKEDELARLAKEVTKIEGEIGRIESKLSNEGFVARAPEAVIAKEREKLEGYAEAKAKLIEQQAIIAAL